MSSAGAKIATLKRRRNHLAARARSGEARGFDRSETSALTLAIRVLENARALGVLGDLASLSQIELAIVEGVERGHTVAEIARSFGVSKWTAKDHVSRLCRIYGCSMSELPDRIRGRETSGVPG